MRTVDLLEQVYTSHTLSPSRHFKGYAERLLVFYQVTRYRALQASACLLPTRPCRNYLEKLPAFRLIGSVGSRRWLRSRA